MTWPAILASPQQGGWDGERERERKGSAGASSVSISISAPMRRGRWIRVWAEWGDAGTGWYDAGAHPHALAQLHAEVLESSGWVWCHEPGKGSAGEVDPAAEREGKEKEKRGVASPFHFGGAAQSKALPPTPGSAESPPLTPPHIILEPAALLREPSNTLRPPSSVDGADGRRASQIVYATGFVSRLTTAALASPRAWKAFRMEVRGTKLVLHKPPSDRAAGVRDLFPAGLVEDEQETLTVDDAGGAQRREVGSMGRKKRAYWGRGRHPALSVAVAGASRLQEAFSNEQAKGGLRGQIEKGSFEALMHELVFATVFLRAEADEEEAAQREKQWRDYARAALLCLPLLVGRARVETEFRARVAWMAREHLGLHGAPGRISGATRYQQMWPSKGPASASTQAMYAPLPVGTPALGAAPFSPRPDHSARIVGLLDALSIQEPVVPQSPPAGALSSPRLPQQPRGGPASRMPWALDKITHVFADCSAGDPSAPLFGCDAAPHWLTRLLLVHLLGSDTSSATTQTPGGEQQGTSRTYSRSEVISVWARVGELCRAAGDECTWRAIVAALCSAPVARLDKVWRRAEGPALAAVEGWARLEGEGCEVREPRVTPWGGAIQAKLNHSICIVNPSHFPEVFPTSTPIDGAQLLRGRVDSDTNPRLLRLDPEHLSNQPRRDIGGLAGLNQTGTVIPVYNCEVLLAVWHGTEGESSASSRPSSRLPSRPPSSVIDSINGEGLSRALSVCVKPGSSQGLDRKTSVARRNSLPSPSQRRAFVASEPSTEPPLPVRVLAGTLNWLCDISWCTASKACQSV
ncbi:hypothetical protein DFH06DRAFT_1402750 [Mycena polygramma]|nr:hypothetical protein DFH06DRAFT_1402750 [Mycena polygramma]